MLHYYGTCISFHYLLTILQITYNNVDLHCAFVLFVNSPADAFKYDCP